VPGCSNRYRGRATPRRNYLSLAFLLMVKVWVIKNVPVRKGRLSRLLINGGIVPIDFSILACPYVGDSCGITPLFQNRTQIHKRLLPFSYAYVIDARGLGYLLRVQRGCTPPQTAGKPRPASRIQPAMADISGKECVVVEKATRSGASARRDARTSSREIGCRMRWIREVWCPARFRNADKEPIPE